MKKVSKTRFRRTKEEIEMNLTLEQAKQQRLTNNSKEYVEFVGDVTKTIVESQIERRNRRYQRKQWCFTLNNYTPEDVQLFKDFIETQCSIGAFQSELGETRKTPHLQGFFVTFEKRRFTSFKLSEKTHWELMRGSVPENINYCLKAKGFDAKAGVRFLHNCDMPKESRMKHLLHRKTPVLDDSELFAWQKRVCDTVIQTPDDRIIYYKYDQGNTGKSQLVKKLVMEYEALSLDGSKTNMAYTIMDFYNKKGFFPPVIVVDIPRSQSARWSSENDGGQSYSGIEAIKNGVFNSTKYESQMITMPTPHIFIFSNTEPNPNLFTKDRWRIEEIQLSPEEELTLQRKKEELRAMVDNTLSPPPQLDPKDPQYGTQL